MSDEFSEITPSVEAVNSPAVLQDEVLRRIEVYTLELLSNLLDKTPGVKRTRSTLPHEANNTGHSGGVQSKTDAGASFSSLDAVQRKNTNAPSFVSLRTLQQTRQHLLLLRLLYQNVQDGVVQTHRDVFYHLVREIPVQDVVNRTVRQLVAALRVPRQLLGVTAGGRGFVAGSLCYRGSWVGGRRNSFEALPLPLLEADLVVRCVEEDNDGGWTQSEEKEDQQNEGKENYNLRTSQSVHSSPDVAGEDASAATDAGTSGTSASWSGFQVRSNVRFILVVEKHAVFAHLLREGLPRLLPCVLLTSQGFPTHAAHKLLFHLHSALPRAVVVGLVDFNPHGLSILAAYRWVTGANEWDGSADGAMSSGRRTRGGMPENRFCAVPALRWFGLRVGHVQAVQRFTQRDKEGTKADVGARPGVSTVGARGAESLHLRNAGPIRPFNSEAPNTKNLSSLQANVSANVSSSGKAVSAQHSASMASSSSSPPLTLPCPSAVVPAVLPPLQPFTSRDSVLMGNFISQLESRLHTATLRCRTDEAASLSLWLREAHAMRRLNAKCELEVLYTHPFSTLFTTVASLGQKHNARLSAPSCSTFDFDASEEKRPWGSARLSTAPAPGGNFAMWVAEQLLKGHYI